MTRRVVALALALASVGWGPGVGPAQGADPAVRVVSQTLAVSVERPIEVVLAWSGGGRPPEQVQVEARLVGEEGVRAWVSNPSGDPLDTVTVAPERVDASTVRVVVPVETDRDRTERLRLPDAGAYAVTLRLRGTAVTVPVIRREAGAPGVPTAVVMLVDSPLTVQPDGTTAIDPGVRRSVAGLAGALERSPVPVSVLVRPELVAGLARSGLPDDDALLTRLGVALGSHSLLSMPYVHLDPSVAAAAGRQRAFVEQLRMGDDTLRAELGRLPDRRVWVAADPLSPAGASLVRNLGAGVVVRLAGPALVTGEAADPPVDLPVVVPDAVGGLVASPTADPVLAAAVVAVELLVTHHDGHGLVLMPDLASADPSVLDALLAIVGREVDGLRPASLEDVAAAAGPVPDEPSAVVPELSSAFAVRDRLLTDAATTAAVLPDDDERRTRWPALGDALLDTRLSPAARADYERGLRDAVLGVQRSIVLLAPSTVNLGDRSSTVPLSVRNDGTVPVSVVVRLSSAKLRFPPTSDVVTVDPGTTVFVRIPVDARTNGRFPVTAELLAPGTVDRIGEPVTFSVRVGRLTGLGIVVTFAAFLVLATWWVQHLRRRRQAQGGTAARERHPVSGRSA